MSPSSRTLSSSSILRVVAALLIAWSALIPLAAVLSHRARISVLQSLEVDSAAYDAIAADLARTRSLDAIPPLQPPGFVASLAAVYLITGHSWTAARVWLWLAFVGCVALSAALAWRLYEREAAAWLAAALTASAPALHGYVGTIQYELIAAFWLLALLLACDWARERRIVAWALAGVICAAASLTREVFVATVPVIALTAAWSQRRDARTALAAALVVIACAALPVAGWAAYQSTRTGRAVALSDKGPLVLAFGNNPRANGTFNAPAVGVGEPSGVAFIRAHPGEFVRLAGPKFLYFWGVLRDGWNVPRPAAVWLARATGGLVPLEAMLPLARGGWILAALVAALVCWRASLWERWWGLPVAIAAIVCVHLLTVSSHRFAVPVLPAAFAVIAGPVASAGAWMLSGRRRRAAAVLAIAVAGLMQVWEWPVRYTLRAADLDGLNIQNATLDEGPVRIAGAAEGARPVLLLSDEALPRGTFTVALRVRGGSDASRPMAHVTLRTSGGIPLCESSLGGRDLPPGVWRTISFPCAMAADAVVTVRVDTTGVADLQFADVRLQW